MSGSNCFWKVLIPLVLISGMSIAQELRINEVMFDPAGSDYYDEFIEIYNLSDSVVSLEGFVLSINGYLDYIEIVADTFILPGRYGVILDRGYLIGNLSTTYDEILPDSTPLFTIQDNAFGQNGLSNSSGNQIVLLNSQGDTLSSILTTPDQPSGYSDEKIIPEGSDGPENWGNSVQFLGTPGFRNSISPRDFDLSLNTEVDTTVVEMNDTLKFRIVVSNSGLSPAEGAEVRGYLAWNQDSITTDDSLILHQPLPIVEVGDSIVIPFSVGVGVPGWYLFLFTLYYDPDEVPGNDRQYLSVYAHYPPGILAINEIMYLTSEGNSSEWLELYNCADYSVNLKGFLIADLTKAVEFVDCTYLLSPGDYFVIFNSLETQMLWQVENSVNLDGDLPSLNNSGDSITVLDNGSERIDGVFYRPSWGGSEDCSLERRSPFYPANFSYNWGTSLSPAGATPGDVNSILLPDYDISITIDSCKSRADSTDIFKVFFSFRNEGLNRITELILHLFLDDSEIEAREMAVDISTFQTMSDSLEVAQITSGEHHLTLSLEIPSDENLENNQDSVVIFRPYPRKSLVINEVMYLPRTEEGEWIELYNPGSAEVNLKGLILQDKGGNNAVISVDDYWLSPDSYCVIADDNSLLDLFPEITAQLLLPENGLPSLNNDEDSLFVLNPDGTLIEAIWYSETFGRATGISLERVDPANPDCDSTNWRLSVAPQGCTPAAPNSVLIRRYNLKAYWQCDSLHITETDTITVSANLLIQNLGKEYLTGCTLVLYDDFNQDGELTDNEVIDELSWQLDSLGYYQVDTIGLTLQIGEPGIHPFIAVVLTPAAVTDTTDYLWVFKSYPAGALVVNEIMYRPESGLAEWLELYNCSSLHLNLQGWSLSDASGKKETLSNQPFYLPSGEFAVITGSPDLMQDYPFTIDYLISCPDFPSLNNVEDEIVIRDYNVVVIDSVRYSYNWGGSEGVSLERRRYDVDSNDSTNWGSSCSSWGATPGEVNSISPAKYDLGLVEVILDTLDIDSCWSLKLGVTVENYGYRFVDNCSLEVLIDGQSSFQIEITAIGERKRYEIGICQICPGRHHLEIILKSVLDDRTDNDTLESTVNVPFPAGILRFNEVMRSPGKGLPGSCEWVEVVNVNRNPLSLSGWCLSDRRSRSQEVSDNRILQEGELLVISADSAIFELEDIVEEKVIVLFDFPALNNVEDWLYLQDPAGLVIDSLHYDTTWPLEEGKSLEKIAPALVSSQRQNWRLSLDPSGSTPTRRNSLTPSASSGILSLSSKSFSPNGDGVNDVLKIYYSLPFSPVVTVRIFDIAGRNVQNLLLNEPTSCINTVIWDGNTRYGYEARIGVYIIYFLAKNPAGKQRYERLKTVLLEK